MSSGSTRSGAYADLVNGLLDARVDPATERFDAELSAAVAAGTVTPEAARTLRFWQRASLRALADHARSVLPVTLGALDASWRESHADVEAAQRSWEAAERTRTIDLTDTASTPAVSTPSSPEGRRRRLIVAGLTTSTPSVAHTDHS